MKKIIILCIAVSSAACSSPGEKNHAAGFTLKGDTIIINRNDHLLENLKIDTVNPAPYKVKFSISGIVRSIPNNYAEVASPFAGRITRSFVRLGQHVNIDSPIFEISSPSFYDAGKAYYQSKQEMQLAEKNLKRQKDLLANGVGVQKDVEEAEMNFELSRRDYENSIVSLSVYHVRHEDLVPGQPLIVRSPIAGEIVANNIVIGQYLKEDAQPVAIVAELSRIWVVGQLKEKDIRAVHESDEVVVRLTEVPDVPVKGKVYHINEILDEETRSVQVLIECENEDHLMKPGMYVTAEFSNTSCSSILIPSSSILQTEATRFVFKKINDNSFVRQPVEIAGSDNDLSIIKSGLNAGDRFVSRGSIYLSEAI